MSENQKRNERCKHGIRWPHECKDCLNESSFAAPTGLDAGAALKNRMEANGWLKSKQWPDHTAANWKGIDGSEKSIKELLYELLESI